MLRPLRPGRLHPQGMSRRPKPARSATRRRAPRSTRNGAPASTTAATSLLRVSHGADQRGGRLRALRQMISTIVTPRIVPLPRAGGGRVQRLAPCQGRTHPRLAGQRAGRSGRRKSRLQDPDVSAGVSAAAVNGAAVPRRRGSAHGQSQARPGHLAKHGIGRINRTGARAPARLHSRHEFSAARPAPPTRAGNAHGPDHPQIEIYNESSTASLTTPTWTRWPWTTRMDCGEDYSAAPTCATCHMSATKNQRVTHDVGLRISWNNRPEISIRPEVSDPSWACRQGRDLADRRTNMVDVCLNCTTSIS